MAWIYVFIASLLEAFWTFSLKFLSFNEIKNLPFHKYWEMEGFFKLFPLLGYIVFGIGNVYFFSMALKTLPTATAMAVWMALALIFIKISEVVFFQDKFNWSEAFFLLLISIGIVGLKVTNSQ
ncbi:MAG: SMR family transporter [Bacteroidota bacterium]